MTPRPGADGFRHGVQGLLDGFVDLQDRRLAPLGDDAARIVDGGTRARSRAASGSGRCSATGGSVPSARPRTRPRTTALLRAARRSSCCTPRRSCTTTTWTPRTRGAVSRRRTARSAARTATRAGAATPTSTARPRAILLGDLLLVVVRRAAAHLRAARRRRGSRRCGCFDTTRSEVIVGQFLDVSVQARGDSDVEPVDAGAALQVGEVLHRAAAPRRRDPGRGDPATSLGRAARVRRCRWARRSSCVTTCSASSATPR